LNSFILFADFILWHLFVFSSWCASATNG